MYDEFINKLEEDEKILYYGVSNVRKTSKQYFRFLLGFVVLLLFWILVIDTIKSNSILNLNILICFITLCILTVCLFYGLIYNIFLKYKRKSSEYFITNKRIAIYNLKTGLRIGNISDIERIGIIREKNNCGDLIFNFYASNLIEQLKNTMSFEGVGNPRKIVTLICEVNNRIHIYDDRPIVMGKKI